MSGPASEPGLGGAELQTLDPHLPAQGVEHVIVLAAAADAEDVQEIGAFPVPADERGQPAVERHAFLGVAPVRGGLGCPDERRLGEQLQAPAGLARFELGGLVDHDDIVAHRLPGPIVLGLGGRAPAVAHVVSHVVTARDVVDIEVVIVAVVERRAVAQEKALGVLARARAQHDEPFLPHEIAPEQAAPPLRGQVVRGRRHFTGMEEEPHPLGEPAAELVARFSVHAEPGRHPPVGDGQAARGRPCSPAGAER